jgi:hypothetical protein
MCNGKLPILGGIIENYLPYCGWGGEVENLARVAGDEQVVDFCKIGKKRFCTNVQSARLFYESEKPQF